MIAPTFYPWAEAPLRMEPPIDLAWKAFRNQILELRAQNLVERAKSAIAMPETPTIPEKVRKVVAVDHARALVRNTTFHWSTRRLRLQSRVMDLTEQVSEAGGKSGDRTPRGKVPGLFSAASGSGGAPCPGQTHGPTGATARYFPVGPQAPRQRRRLTKH